VLFEKTNCLIVVPTYNEEESIRDCLSSILLQATGCSVIVSDGQSTDKTQSIVSEMAEVFDNLKFLNNPKRIQSAGINLAVKHYAKDHHSVIIRCDAHSRYPGDFVDQILQSFRAHNVASVVVPLIASGTNGFSNAAAWIVDSRIGNGGAKHRGGSYSGFVDHGHHAGIRLDWFKRLGGYDEEFAHNEDAEFDVRLAQLGAKIWMNGLAPVQYQMRTSLFRLAKQYFFYGHGRARNTAKHNSVLKIRQRLPVLNFLLLTTFGLGAFFWWPLVSLIAVYGIILAAVSFCGLFSLRRVSGLWAGLAVGAMHHAWAVGFLRQRIAG